MSKYYIGLMSGTSLDGIDAAICDIQDNKFQVLGTHNFQLPESLTKQCEKLNIEQNCSFKTLAKLDNEFAQNFANCVLQILKNNQLTFEDIIAIGSHGQTICHLPDQDFRYSLQIGCPNKIAALTNIPTVGNFRAADLAKGGQGAPLVPPFHHYLFAGSNPKIIVNIGGIANLTLVSKNLDQNIIGYDLGPGNCLMDLWVQAKTNQKFDINGKLAQLGKINQALLNCLLDDQFFNQQPPKSTGKDYFNQNWLTKKIGAKYQDLNNHDILATLSELTAVLIANNVNKLIPKGEVLIAGGGAHNKYLLSRIQANLGDNYLTTSTEKYLIDPDYIEACAFAWLAYKRINLESINYNKITGSSHPVIAGGLYLP